MQIEDKSVPGALGTIAALHGANYVEHRNFGTHFKAEVASEIASLAKHRKDDDLVPLALGANGVATSLVLD